MTRSEAARHAALVRYGKENPFQARLAEIRALRQAKQAAAAARQKKLLAGGGKGGKGKGKSGSGKSKAAAKPKADPKAKQSERDKATAARQAERDKAKVARDQERAGKQAEREKTKAAAAEQRKAAQAERQQAREKRAADRAKAAKEKAKEKAKSSDRSNTPKEKVDPAKNRTAVISKMQANDAPVSKVGMDALGSLANGDGIDEQSAGELEKMGLIERDSEGKPRATTQARALLRAADKGDYGAALDAISRAKDKVAATAQRNAVKKSVEDIDMPSTYTPILDDLRAIIAEANDIGADDGAVKAGRRNNSSDQDTIDQGYELAGELQDIFAALGANTGEEDDEAPDAKSEGDEDMSMDNADEMKAIAENPVAYAYQECGGIQQATDALRILAQLAASEASEQDDDTSTILSQLRQAMLIITGYINGEIGELKAIEAREDVNPKAGISKYGKGAIFADEKNKKYPLSDEQGALDEGKIRAAWNYINKPDNAGKYADDEVAFIKKKIVNAWKEAIDKAGPPSAQDATKKSVDDTVLGDFAETVYGGEIKSIGDGDAIGGYAILFGGPDTPDMSMHRDYFTKSTELWLEHFGWPRPILYHHAMEPTTADAPVIGHWTKAQVDDVGVFLSGELDRAHRYYSAVKELIRRGYLKLSSDSAPHLVRRFSANGVNEIKRWPLITASATVSPAEPRMLPLELKMLMDELGIENVDQPTIDTDAAKADDDRARALELELALLELELTTA